MVVPINVLLEEGFLTANFIIKIEEVSA